MFDFNTLKGKQVVLYGAGKEGIWAIDVLKKNGISPVCFCDMYKNGVEPKTGLTIISPDELTGSYTDAMIVIAAITYVSEMLGELKRLDIPESRIITDFIVHVYKQPYLTYFELNICDHCDISCKGCSHFSPLAEEHAYSLQTVQSDLKRISELTAQNVDEIHIMGGEPLLHPDLSAILSTARESFPGSIISLITNGVLLLKQDETFWNTCKDKNITIEVTKYPIKLDYEGIIKAVESRGIAFKFHSYTGKAIKTLMKQPLDMEGGQNADDSFLKCTLANCWVALMDGKLFTCQIAPNIIHFNKHFGTNLDLEEGDYLDIYKVKDIDEVLSFLSRPKPFCRYCKTDELVSGIPWQPSKKEMNEWVL